MMSEEYANFEATGRDRIVSGSEKTMVRFRPVCVVKQHFQSSQSSLQLPVLIEHS